MELEELILDLVHCDGVRFDIQHDTNGPIVFGPDGKRFLRLTSTRELLTDEIRDRILDNWREALDILSHSLQDELDLSNVTGLCVWQSDYGFDPHKLEFRNDHNIEGHYRF
jgi:hypothetical protein